MAGKPALRSGSYTQSQDEEEYAVILSFCHCERSEAISPLPRREVRHSPE